MGEKRGFTLIELMIVIAIIAVIAAIAIPSLLRNRIASNETAAKAACRTIGAAQTTWKRNDYDLNRIFDYTANYSQLYYAMGLAGEPIGMIDKALADARLLGAPPRNGYNGLDVVMDAVTGVYNMSFEYGICMAPSKYNRSGVNTFVMNVQGVVYQADLGPAGVGTQIYPNINLAGSPWLPSH